MLRAFVCGIVTACLLGSTAGTTAAESQPNILWITCEDISPNLGCYGDPDACTPNLDRLAAEGTRYTNAYGITGVCSPNRSCLITGVYPSTLGSHGMRSTTWLPEAVKCFPEYLRRAGYYCTNNVKTDYNFAVPPEAWDESSRTAHWRNRRPGQPFFAVFNFTVTHESQIRVPEAAYRRNTARLKPDQFHDPDEVSIPPFHPDTPESRKDWARYHDNITAMDYQAGDILRQLEEDGLADDTIVFFFSDHGAGMPGIKKWVWGPGLKVPLLVRFPKKYARWAPTPPGGTTDRLVSFVDFAPTVLSLAGVAIPEAMQGVPFLGPQAGPPRKYVYAIRDRMAERFDMVRVVRSARFQYNRNFYPHLPWSQYVEYTEQMPTMKVWRRLHEEGKLNPVQDRYFQTKPVEELYDTAADPYQVHNLADDPRYADVLAEMRAECRRWMIATGDLGLLPEQAMLDRAEGRTPYDVAFDRRANPVAELLEAAELANRRDPKCIDDLVALTAHDDPVFRYWGLVGLVALKDQARPAESEVRRLAVDATEPGYNRAVAAEVLYELGDVQTALDALTALLESTSPLVRLQAINVLDRMGKDALPAVEAMKRASMKNAGHVGGYLNQMTRYVPARLEANVRKE